MRRGLEQGECIERDQPAASMRISAQFPCSTCVAIFPPFHHTFQPEEKPETMEYHGWIVPGSQISNVSRFRDAFATDFATSQAPRAGVPILYTGVYSIYWLHFKFCVSNYISGLLRMVFDHF